MNYLSFLNSLSYLTFNNELLSRIELCVSGSQNESGDFAKFDVDSYTVAITMVSFRHTQSEVVSETRNINQINKFYFSTLQFDLLSIIQYFWW